MKSFFVCLVLVFSFISCSIDDGTTDFKIETLPIKSAIVPDSFTFGRQYTISVTYELPSSCHAFYELFYQYKDTARVIAVNSIVDQSNVCTDGLIEQEYRFLVSVVQEEDYTFKFWKGVDTNGENIFEEIIVPVNNVTIKE